MSHLKGEAICMNDHELERFEAELRQVRPSLPPADFIRRLKADGSTPAPAAGPDPRPGPAWVQTAGLTAGSWWRSAVLRWLVPAAALFMVGAFAWRASWYGVKPAPVGRPMQADDVRIDQELVSSFDTVAELPNGEPVRFRCHQWMDEVVVRDSKRGLEVARRVPRVEVIPVRFEAY